MLSVWPRPDIFSTVWYVQPLMLDALSPCTPSPRALSRNQAEQVEFFDASLSKIVFLTSYIKETRLNPYHFTITHIFTKPISTKSKRTKSTRTKSMGTMS